MSQQPRITITESMTGNRQQVRFDGAIIAVEHPGPASVAGMKYLAGCEADLAAERERAGKHRAIIAEYLDGHNAEAGGVDKYGCAANYDACDCALCASARLALLDAAGGGKTS